MERVIFQVWKVDYVTSVINNGKIVKVLVTRRQLIKKLRLMVRPWEVFDWADFDNMIEEVKPKKHKAALKFLEKIQKQGGKAWEMFKEKKLMSEVFVIFETEQG